MLIRLCTRGTATMSLYALALASLVVSAAAQDTCTFHDWSTGSDYSFTRLSNPTTDYVVSDPGGSGFTFYLNMCRQVVSSTRCPAGAGVCQHWGTDGKANLGLYPPTYQSLTDACGIQHEGFDYVGYDIADSPYVAMSAQDCCNTCRGVATSDAYAFRSADGYCWCKRIGDIHVEPTPQEDRVFGRIGTPSFYDSGVVVHYTGGDRNRATTIYLICNQNEGIGAPRFLFERPQLFYYFEWETQYACPTRTTGSVTTTTGLIPATTAANPVREYSISAIVVNTPSGNRYQFDFSALKSSNTDYVTFDHLGHTFVMNFGRNTIDTTCGTPNAAICQFQTENRNNKYLIGTYDSRTFEAPTNGKIGVVVNFGSGDNDRKARLEIYCSQNSGAARPVFVAEEPQLTYLFAWPTALACPGTSGQVATTGVDTSTTGVRDATTFATRYYDRRNQRFYDISSLMRNDVDWVTYDDQNRPFYINIGRSTISTDCSDTTFICQTWQPFGSARITGKAGNAATFGPLPEGGDVHGFRLTLSGGDDGRKAAIDFRCGDPFNIGSPVFNNEDTTLEYYFDWTTNAACGVSTVSRCTFQSAMDFGGYDTALSPFYVADQDSCCGECKTQAANAFAFQPTQGTCWCKNVPHGSTPYPMVDRVYGTIEGSVGTTGAAETTDDSSQGLTGLETFFIIVFVMIAVGAASYAGFLYYKRRQGNGGSAPQSYMHLNLQTNDLMEDN